MKLAPEKVKWTIPGLFEVAYQRADLKGEKDIAIVLEVEPELGYPQNLARDNEVALDDDEGLSVLEFKQLAP